MGNLIIGDIIVDQILGGAIRNNTLYLNCMFQTDDENILKHGVIKLPNIPNNDFCVNKAKDEIFIIPFENTDNNYEDFIINTKEEWELKMNEVDSYANKIVDETN